jgi:hypothetical protein
VVEKSATGEDGVLGVGMIGLARTELELSLH